MRHSYDDDASVVVGIEVLDMLQDKKSPWALKSFRGTPNDYFLIDGYKIDTAMFLCFLNAPHQFIE